MKDTEPQATVSETACRCGYTVKDPVILPKGNYSLLAWMLWGVGISSCPRKVELICPVCSHLFETITNPLICNKYRYK